MRPGPVFILTFEAALGRCLSSDLKRNIWVRRGCPRGARPHQDPPQGLTFSLERLSPGSFFFFAFLFWSRHGPGSVSLLPTPVLQHSGQDVPRQHV